MAGYGELYGGSFSSGYRNTGSKGVSSGVKKGAATGAVEGTATGLVSGAALGSAITAGAAAGSVIPGLGTLIGAGVGAAVGFIGGLISGGFSGGRKAKEKYYKKLAAQVQQQREANSTYNQYLQMIRQARIANAQSVATAATSGLEYSSAFYGASSGIKSQSAYSVQYLAEDRRLQALYAEYMRKAGKNASIANDIDAGWDAIQSLSLSAGQAANIYKSLYGKNDTTEPWVTEEYNKTKNNGS